MFQLAFRTRIAPQTVPLGIDYVDGSAEPLISRVVPGWWEDVSPTERTEKEAASVTMPDESP